MSREPTPPPQRDGMDFFDDDWPVPDKGPRPPEVAWDDVLARLRHAAATRPDVLPARDLVAWEGRVHHLRRDAAWASWRSVLDGPVPYGRDEPSAKDRYAFVEEVERTLAELDALERATIASVAAVPVTLATSPTSHVSARSAAPDYSSVRWDGRTFHFPGAIQRNVVRLLWEDFERGGTGLSEEHLRDASGSGAQGRFRVADLFRTKAGGPNPAIGTMICRSGRGVWRIGAE